MNQIKENHEKPNFRSNFDPFVPNLDPPIFFLVDFTSTCS